MTNDESARFLYFLPSSESLLSLRLIYAVELGKIYAHPVLVAGMFTKIAENQLVKIMTCNGDATVLQVLVVFRLYRWKKLRCEW